MWYCPSVRCLGLAAALIRRSAQEIVDCKRDAHFPNVLCYRILRFVTQIDVEYCCIWPVPLEEFQCATPGCRGSRQRGRIQVDSHKLFKGLSELARSSQVVASWLTGDAWGKRSNALGISHCRFSIVTPAILQALKRLHKVVDLSTIRRSTNLFECSDKSVYPVR